MQQLTMQHDAITVWLRAKSAGRTADQAVSTARRTAARRAADRADRQWRHDTELERLRLWAQHHGAELARIEQDELAVRNHRTALQQSRRGVGKFLDSLGIGAVSRLLAQEEQLLQARAAAYDAYRNAYHHHALAQDAGHRLATALAEEERTDQAAVRSAGDAHEEVMRQVDEATTALGRLGLDQPPADEAAASELRQSLDASRQSLRALADKPRRSPTTRSSRRRSGWRYAGATPG
jgi:hypothetical protein